MKKNLPNIYRGNVKNNTNLKVAYAKKEEEKVNPKIVINELFKKNKIYKQDVYIETNDKTLTTKIIGRTESHIISINNEVIKIDDINTIKILK